MSRYIPVALQTVVAERASFRCEYCRLPEIAALVKFHFEHIISLKHGGKTEMVLKIRPSVLFINTH